MRLKVQKLLDDILSQPSADGAWACYGRIFVELMRAEDDETMNELMDQQVDLQIRHILGELSPEMKEEMARVLPSPEQQVDQLLADRKQAALDEQWDAVALADKILEEFKARGLPKSN